MPTSRAGRSLRALYDEQIAAHGFEPDAAQLRAIERLEDLRTRLLRAGAPGQLRRRMAQLRRRPLPAIRGLYLWGSVGRGKTWLMDLFHDSIAFSSRRRSHFHHFMREVHGELTRIRDHSDPLAVVAARMARRARVLCLDELYVSDIADAMILGGLFEQLLHQGVTLVLTSNVPPAQLYRDGLQRARFLPAIALLEAALEILPLDGSVDYRLRQLRQASIYLDSTAADSEARLAALFRQLAGEHGDAHAELQVQGRRLRAQRRSSDVVWFDFATLCTGARSQNDYIEIARDFHTVFLSNVPVLGDPDNNAARRFIALIDELYDQGVKLVLSAAAAPARLYGGERLRFEFQRTHSRLVEMQSEEYLARAHRG
ncbi:MAG: AFG1 family ATPase [Gammaproteobacteria bacterium]|nr:AFG1 family ATPase [Gammaproteobacteria bacterium]